MALKWEQGDCCRRGDRGTHLVTSDMEPPGTRMQLHDLVYHGSDQCQGLRLVGVQGVGEKCHFSEVSESLMLQHKLQRDDMRELSDTGERSSCQAPCSRGLLRRKPAFLAPASES